MATIRSRRRPKPSEKDGALRVTGTKLFVCADGADGFLVSAAGARDPRCSTWRAMRRAARLRRRRRSTVASSRR